LKPLAIARAACAASWSRTRTATSTWRSTDGRSLTEAGRWLLLASGGRVNDNAAA
jgi:hypothetical protein